MDADNRPVKGANDPEAEWDFIQAMTSNGRLPKIADRMPDVGKMTWFVHRCILYLLSQGQWATGKQEVSPQMHAFLVYVRGRIRVQQEIAGIAIELAREILEGCRGELGADGVACRCLDEVLHRVDAGLLASEECLLISRKMQEIVKTDSFSKLTFDGQRERLFDHFQAALSLFADVITYSVNRSVRGSFGGPDPPKRLAPRAKKASGKDPAPEDLQAWSDAV